MTTLLLALLTSPSFAKERPAPLPEPLPPRAMKLEDPQIGELSNGIEVRVAPNHEVPLFEVRLVFGVGEYADPEGKEGLASLTFDLLDEGAGERDAAAMAAELKRLAGNVYSSADSDSGTVGASGLKRNMAQILDVWTDVVLSPTFPEKEWKLIQKRQVSNLRLAAEDPNEIARTAYRKLVWGDGYIGRPVTATSVESLTLDDAKGFHGKRIGPDNAILLVGGDVTLDEIQPLLEERIGSWSVEGFEQAPVVAEPKNYEKETIYLVDKPGAAQSVIRGISVVGTLEDSDVFDLMVGNHMLGRDFTGRINMNLREDKGYTYGARCFLVYRHGPGIYLCTAGVRTDVTAESLTEFRAELAGAIGDKPLTEAEVATARDAMAYGWPGQFETTGPILDLEFEIWRYGKPEDWAADYVPAVRKVTTEGANAALKKWIDPTRTIWLIVGDKSVISEKLQGIGLPIVELDRDGNPL